MRRIRKLLFIYPQFRRFYRVLAEWSPIFGKDYEAQAETRTPPCLAFPILAALTPPGIEIDFLDDRIDRLDFGRLDADLYCLHVKTEMAPRAYQLADALRAAGKRVVLGGLHVTYCPDEARQHADAVVVGDAEGVWQQLLADAERGGLQPVYRRSQPVDMRDVPIPERSIYDRYRYSNPVNYLQVSRGCMLTCAGCPIPAAYGKRIRFRPLELVEAELNAFPASTIYITDDNLFFSGAHYADYTDQLLRLLARVGKPSSWASAIGLPRRCDDEFLRLARDANVHAIYNVLYDSLSTRAIEGHGPSLDRFREIYDKYREAGIQIWMSVYVGLDRHDRRIADQVLTFLTKVRAELVEFVIPTPFPETPLWYSAQREGRLLHTRWEDYDGLHAVHRPKHFTPEELEAVVRTLWIEFYSHHPYIFDRDDIKVLLNT